jgi:outer membrane protein, heavy metal efflux system
MSQKMLSVACVVVLGMALRPAIVSAQVVELPAPLSLADVVRIASDQRDEMRAARARVRAGEARPAIVSALEDPMIMPSLDHLPFMLGGADVSVVIEQRIPLSGIRRHRRSSALAEVERLRAEAQRTGLDVAAEAAAAFLMLQERRRTAELVAGQLAAARDIVTAANARYAAGAGPQADVLRAEVEVARLESTARALGDEIAAAGAMLNTSLARDVRAPIPDLAPLSVPPDEVAWMAVETARATRPELAASRADIARADADVRAMRDMFRPMATIRTGPAYTMAEGRGWMAMVGVSVPIWRGRLRAGLAEAEAMRAMSEADAQAMARMIDGEAAVSLHALRAARARQVAISTDVLPRARMAIEPAVAAYSAGRLPLVSVLEAVQALWFVESDLIAADTELGLAWVRLGRAVGSYEAMIP